MARRFKRSKFYKRLMEMPDEETREEFLHHVLKATGTGSASGYDAEEDIDWNWLNEQLTDEDLHGPVGTAGGGPNWDYITQVAMVAGLLHKVPKELILLAKSTKHFRLVPVDEPADEWDWRKATPAEASDDLWLPPTLYLERAARMDLRKKRWERREIVEDPKKKIGIVVDSSGSMHGKPHAFATATAIRMSEEAGDGGHEVMVWFYGMRISNPIKPMDVLRNLGKLGNLNAGDDFTGAAMAKVEQDFHPDDLVVVSDFQTHQEVQLSHAFGMGMGPEVVTQCYQVQADLHMVVIGGYGLERVPGLKAQAKEIIRVGKADKEG
jgi:hypothetical protein